MGIKSVQDSPQFRFRLWGFLGVMFRPVIYPSLFFFFAFGSRFFMVNRGQSTQLNIFVGFDFFFLQACAVQWCDRSRSRHFLQEKAAKHKQIFLGTMKPFFGAASSLFVLLLLDSTAAQQSAPTQPTRINFQDTSRDNNQRPNLFNNNIDPFSRRPFGVGDNANAIFEEP